MLHKDRGAADVLGVLFLAMVGCVPCVAIFLSGLKRFRSQVVSQHMPGRLMGRG
ncbi:MAG TPA: hypothetical protein VF784_17005 [Anaerolineales bacterium]